MSESARMTEWDGSWAKGKCNHIGCANPSVLHLEMSSPGSEYAAESDLCEEHLPAVAEQTRAFLVALSVIAPSTPTEQNIKAASGEHIGA